MSCNGIHANVSVKRGQIGLFAMIWILSISISFSFQMISSPSKYSRILRYPNARYNKQMTTLILSQSLKASEITVEIEESFIPLDTGVTMQVLKVQSTLRKASPKPPLLLIHGSFHAAWCWTEHYMPYFASLGYDSIAISLRGTGGTPALDGEKRVKIETHIYDLKSYLDIYFEDNQKPVIIAHSFGGILAMKYIEKYSNLDQFQ